MKGITKVSIKNFLENELKESLEKEINSYLRLIQYRHKDADDVITYNELAMLSLVKSALIRGKKSDDVWAIQEYSVLDKGNRSKGRADAFFMFREKGFMCDILFEAKKMGHYNSKASPPDKFEWGKFMLDTQAQGERYFKAEEPYFSEPTFVVTIFFEPLYMDDFKLYDGMSDVTLVDSLSYTFYIEPKGSNMKLAVYGHIKKKK